MQLTHANGQAIVINADLASDFKSVLARLQEEA
jgi:hypothetical protein